MPTDACATTMHVWLAAAWVCVAVSIAGYAYTQVVLAELKRITSDERH